MKIVFCIDSLNKGGAERVISILANYFCKDNDVSIITTHSKKSAYELKNNIKLYSLDKNEKRENELKRIRRMRNLIKTIGPDRIVSFMPPQSMRVLISRKTANCKVIVSVRNDPKKEFKPLKYKLAKAILYKKADEIVFQTKEARNMFGKRYYKKSAVIPNPIKKEFFEKRNGDGNKEKTIVSVGRLEPQKNQKMLIDSFSMIEKVIPEYKLIIYGEGSLRKRLESQIEELGLKRRVFLPGTCNNIADKIKNASLFILSSDYEGMPNSLMEAIALGVPCISTDCPCGGPKELLKNEKAGLLVECNNREDMSEKILMILNNKITLEKSEKINDYNEEKIISKWRTAIEDV